MTALIIKGRPPSIVGGGGGGGSEILPDNIHNISDNFCFYRDDVFIKNASNKILYWKDIGGNDRDGVVMNAPTISPDFVSNQINGRSVARFGADGRFEIETPPFGISPETSSFSIFVVAKIPTGVNGQYRGVITNRPFGVTDRWFAFGTGFESAFSVPDGLKIEARHSTNGVTNRELGYTTNNTFSVYSIIKTTSSISVFRNGSPLFADNINVGGGTDSTRPWRIGTWFTTNQSLNGDIPMIAIYRKALSTTERELLEDYANTRYLIY